MYCNQHIFNIGGYCITCGCDILDGITDPVIVQLVKQMSDDPQSLIEELYQSNKEYPMEIPFSIINKENSDLYDYEPTEDDEDLSDVNYTDQFESIHTN